MAAESIITTLSYLPSISWFVQVIKYKEIQFTINEKYTKSSKLNRCYISGANGVIRLSIPLAKGRQQHLPVKDIQLSADQPWQKIHWQSILSAYGKAPFFIYYADMFEEIFSKKESSLVEWNLSLLHSCFEFLNHKKSLVLSEQKLVDEMKGEKVNIIFPRYQQVFENKHGFIHDLSIIDLIFNLGPDAGKYLSDSSVTDI